MRIYGKWVGLEISQQCVQMKELFLPSGTKPKDVITVGAQLGWLNVTSFGHTWYIRLLTARCWLGVGLSQHDVSQRSWRLLTDLVLN